MLYVNPKGESRRWDVVPGHRRHRSEIALLQDVDGDGKLEYIVKDGNNQIVSATPDPANPTAPWIKHPLTERGPWANHGMGLGDVNKDGRVDLLNAYGWWEQPPAGSHAHLDVSSRRRSAADRSSAGGAEMAVYDVNGDGLNDVVTSMQAHGWGCRGSSRRSAAGGAITFVEHAIMGDFSTKNAGDVTFSQPHGIGVRRHRRRRHSRLHHRQALLVALDTYIDPDPHGPPVLYVLSNGAQRRKRRAAPSSCRADSQPVGHRIARRRRGSEQGRRDRDHHLHQARHVHLLESVEKRSIANPILRGFNPDPSIVRVGDDYYIATSTFEWYPGVQIHHSRDLVQLAAADAPAPPRQPAQHAGRS